MLKRLHEGHLGTEKCKRRARTAIYWPGINADVDRIVSTCDTCLKHRAKQQNEPMIVSDPPDEPWQKVGTDLFFLDGQNYLLVIDYLSNYPEIALLPSTSAAGVVTHMKSMFARHGTAFHRWFAAIMGHATVAKTSINLLRSMGFNM